MTVCIDLDEVCNDLCSVVIKLYNEDTGENLTLDDITDYDISIAFKPEYRNRIHQYFNHPQFLDMLTWNVKWLIPIIHNKLDSSYFATATHPNHIYKKCELLCQAIKAEDTIWNSSKLIKDYVYSHLITTSNKKIIKKDILIDDCIANFDFEDNNTFNILVAKPWNTKWANYYNATYLDKQRIIICDNVNDIPEIIEKIRYYKENVNE